MNVSGISVLKTKFPKFLFTQSLRGAAVWNKDLMPGPTPKTPEERAAAAKKYGLLPEEYDFDPEGNGDYPKLPDISAASRSDYYNWDHPHLKKDWGEPMHEWSNFISEDRWDCNHEEKQIIPTWKQNAMYIGVLLAFGIPVYLCNKYKLFFSLPHAKQHFPSDGIHYKYPSSH